MFPAIIEERRRKSELGRRREKDFRGNWRKREENREKKLPHAAHLWSTSESRVRPVPTKNISFKVLVARKLLKSCFSQKAIFKRLVLPNFAFMFGLEL